MANTLILFLKFQFKNKQLHTKIQIVVQVTKNCNITKIIVQDLTDDYKHILYMQSRKFSSVLKCKVGLQTSTHFHTSILLLLLLELLLNYTFHCSQSILNIKTVFYFLQLLFNLKEIIYTEKYEEQLQIYTVKIRTSSYKDDVKGQQKAQAKVKYQLKETFFSMSLRE